MSLNKIISGCLCYFHVYEIKKMICMLWKSFSVFKSISKHWCKLDYKIAWRRGVFSSWTFPRTKSNEGKPCRIHMWKGWAGIRNGFKGPAKVSQHAHQAMNPCTPKPSGRPSFLTQKQNMNRYFICVTALSSNPLVVFNLPAFEQIINVVAIKTKEVNQIQLVGKENQVIITKNSAQVTQPSASMLQHRQFGP